MQHEEFDHDDQDDMSPEDLEAMLEALAPVDVRFYCRPDPSPEVYGQTFRIGMEGEDWHDSCISLTPDELLEVIREGRAWLKAIGWEVDDGSSPS
jgi:hypothetical protein